MVDGAVSFVGAYVFTLGPSAAPLVFRLLSSPLGLWAPVVAYMLAIYFVSSLSQLPQTPGSLTDKHWHAIAYFGLASLWARALARDRPAQLTRRVCVLASLGAIAYGATDELHQAFVPERNSSALDLVADAVGACAAALLLYACGLIARSWRRPIRF